MENKEKDGKARSDLHSARGRLEHELLCYSNGGETWSDGWCDQAQQKNLLGFFVINYFS